MGHWLPPAASAVGRRRKKPMTKRTANAVAAASGRILRLLARHGAPASGSADPGGHTTARIEVSGNREAAEHLPLTAHATGRPALALRPAEARRKWMDETDASFANRCLPLLIANQWGWFILNDRKIELIWNGGPRTPDLHVHYWNPPRRADEQIDHERLSAVSHFGHGVLTFRIPYLFQTPPGWNLYVRGPANWCKDGICPLDGVVETDWSSMTFTVNWKVTRKDTWIGFEEGEPICQIFPVARGSVEAFMPRIRSLRKNPELERRYKEWKQSRSQFYRVLHKSGAKALWQKHYFRGTSILGEAFAGHQTRLAVREFEDTRENPTLPADGVRLDGQRGPST